MNRRSPEVSPYASADFTIHAITDDNATIAVVEAVSSSGEMLRYTGSAKRIPGDRFDATLGTVLATARALQNAADSMLQVAKDYTEEIYGD